MTPAYGSVSSVSTLASSNHIVMLTGLARDTSYYYNILSWVGGKLYTTNGTFATTSTLILNTGDAEYSGFWTASSVADGIFGTYYQSANTTNTNPTAAAAYVPKIPAASNYNVSIWHPQNTNYTTNAQVYIWAPPMNSCSQSTKPAMAGAGSHWPMTCISPAAREGT